MVNAEFICYDAQKERIEFYKYNCIWLVKFGGKNKTKQKQNTEQSKGHKSVWLTA